MFWELSTEAEPCRRYVFCSIQNPGRLPYPVEPHDDVGRGWTWHDLLKTLADGPMAACLLRRRASDMRQFADRRSYAVSTREPVSALEARDG
jgi:hypothetical protein